MRHTASILFAAFILAGCSGGSVPSAPAGSPSAPIASSAGTLSLSLAPSAWQQEYVALAPTVPIKPSSPTMAPGCPAGALCEQFPDRVSDQFMSYLLQAQPERATGPSGGPYVYEHTDASGYKSLAIHLTITAGTGTAWKYDSDQYDKACTGPAHVRPLFVSVTPAPIAFSGAAANIPTLRWYSRYPVNGVDQGACELKAGDCSLTVPFEPAHWVDVNGDPGSTNATTLAGFEKSLANVAYFGIGFGGNVPCPLTHGVATSGMAAKFSLLSYSFGK